MLLTEELERNISAAWVRVRDEILADPDELHRRLARRRMKSLTRPPRAWCIALRACDRRINLATAIITPEHAMDLNSPEHPYEPIEHEVLLVPRTLRRLCHPIRIAFPGEEVDEVAKRTGTIPQSLHKARRTGIFSERFYSGLAGKRGKPVPVIYSQELLDPSSGRFRAPPHELWGSSWEFLARQIPEDFQQPVIRRPYFNSMGAHPDDGKKLKGYRWLCPACRKEVKTIYYPVPVRNLFDCWFTDPVIQLKLNDADLPQTPPATFACLQCHGVRSVGGCDPSEWNYLISQLTGGMLYGCEVEKPPGYFPQRKNKRSRHLNRQAPRRQMVLRRLLNGWSVRRIAKDMMVTPACVDIHIKNLCAQENVENRHELAAKLGAKVSPPFNRDEQAGVRRAKVKELLLSGCSNNEISQKLEIDRRMVESDTNAIYRAHGVGGQLSARQALAQKLGVVLPPTRVEKLRGRIGEMLGAGMKISQIARALEMNFNTVDHHVKHLKRHKENLHSVSRASCP